MFFNGEGHQIDNVQNKYFPFIRILSKGMYLLKFIAVFIGYGGQNYG